MAGLAAELREIVATARQATCFSAGPRHLARQCPECGDMVHSRSPRGESAFTAADAAMSRHLVHCEPFIDRLAAM